MTSRMAAWALVSTFVFAGLSACGGGGYFLAEEGATSIEFALQPEDTVVSNVFQATVVLKKANGDVMPLDGETVNLYLDGNPTGTQLLGQTEKMSRLGVCYFLDSLTIDDVGNGYTLRAEMGDLTAISAPFSILPVQVASIAFLKEPLATPVGVPFEVSVELRDQVGSLLPRDGVPVTVRIRSNPSGGTLSGVTTVDSVQGVCTFPGLSIDAMGDGYSLQAEQTTFTATSAAFNILPPPVAGLAFTVQPPAETDAQAPFGFQVELRDAGNNLTPRSGVQVAVSIENNAGGGTLSGTNTAVSVDGVCDFSGLSITKPGTGYTLKASYGAFETVSGAFNILMLPPTWDATFGTALTGGAASDDSGESVNFGFSFPFYGTTYSNCFVNSNSNITFGSSDSDFSDSVSELSSDQPRIAGWWTDLSPNQQGSVHAKALSDRLVITYNNVNEWGQTGGKTYQVTMWDSGRIDVFYKSMTGPSGSGLIGISPGGNLRSAQSFDFSATTFPSWTNVGSTFPYEDVPSGETDLNNDGWIIFDPLGPSFDGTDGYRFATSG